MDYFAAENLCSFNAVALFQSTLSLRQLVFVFKKD